MEAFYVVVAGTFIPIGFMAVVIAKEFESTFTQNSLVIGGALVAFIGIVILLVAMWLTWQREKSERKKENWEIGGKVLQMDALVQLLAEIKGLRQDLREGGKNGGSKNKSTKPDNS
jgi:protein-S-isoprenylcysteine O-methyltransferase Ste14